MCLVVGLSLSIIFCATFLKHSLKESAIILLSDVNFPINF